MKWEKTAGSADNTRFPNIAELPDTPWRFFLYATKPYQHWAWIAMALVVIAATASQSTSYFLKLIVDAAEAGDGDAVLLYGLLYPVAVFAVQILFRTSGLCGRNWSINARTRSYNALSQYVLRHGHAFFSDRFAGSILSKITNITRAIEDTIPEFLWTHLSAATTFLVTLTYMFLVEPRVGLTFLALIIVLLAMNRLFAPKKTKLSHANAASATALRGKIVDVIGNVQAVRQYARNTQEDEAINEMAVDLREKSARNWGYTEFMLICNTLVLFVFSFVMFWFLTDSWQSGDMTTGSFVFIIALYAQITGLLLFIGRAVNSTARSIGEMREGLEDLVIPYEINDEVDATALSVSDGVIEWKDVHFRFGENNHVFNDFNLHIAPGERVGLVGPSGAGKTTFVSLLLRQHDLGGGAITIDGQNIAEVTQESLRQNIAVVPQEPLLFHRSIKENIAYGKPDATDEEIIEVAQKAQAHDFISTLAEGYDTLVGERGVKLSGGQKQRVAIARAMLKNAPILVLDEATSALDSESEAAIQKALHELMEGKTVIAIAHRLSTLREMDRILVLEAGRIVEDGTHGELAHAGGVYQRLWEHQAGGFLQE